ncbi:2,3-bisphosphoglycerate-independent phosphoglycerate mutase [Deferribacter autotrophicus]|uniref:2,3-bisphosphoglycerate-independent phosphoglycerate mutase n=1 Tax=Deferribacter autotrophicus TaxID=500465 RepID=A0A5A8F3C0_9BACT|nr:2,3-bisphosphoglycerate-independent phosphoglycerate mutase [Deferribacter autotrophicus]KAA0258507.1 2,3-bisphosphoglycerate-independent phosphoglycerate mutase [Deferribacter autotrophicus]
MERKKLILLILDGWGYREEKKNNAVLLSNPKNFLYLWNNYPHTLLNASEEWVGLPKGQMGNSEVGHTNIGAGRVVYQDIVRINKALETGSIKDNKNILKFFELVKKDSGRVHFFGLVSDGGVHSHIDQLKGLIRLAKENGIKEVFVHAFMDGRDTPPKSGIDYIKELDSFLKGLNFGKIATISGRYYAMDRDKRWDRVKKAFDAIRHGEGIEINDPIEAVKDAYDRGETDEFIIPTVVDKKGIVKDGDGVFFFNFRADRARELTMSFINKDFEYFDRKGIPSVHFITMTKYNKDFDVLAAFPPENLKNIFGEVISKEGLRQLRIAETEKYAHVTFFFNGGRELVFENEERILVPSPKDVPTYDLKPEMSVFEVVDRFEEVFTKGDIDVVIMNFANPDMVGHTGVEEAAIKACKAVDEALGKVVSIADKMDAVLIVTADHGNSEQMWDYENNQPHTAHTLNPVPFIVYNYDCKLKDVRGELADIAPTMLEILNIEKPEEMTGESLIVK